MFNRSHMAPALFLVTAFAVAAPACAADSAFARDSQSSRGDNRIYDTGYKRGFDDGRPFIRRDQQPAKSERPPRERLGVRGARPSRSLSRSGPSLAKLDRRRGRAARCPHRCAGPNGQARELRRARGRRAGSDRLRWLDRGSGAAGGGVTAGRPPRALDMHTYAEDRAGRTARALGSQER